MEARKRVLFIVPLPPPVHGSTVMCKSIEDSRLINDSFECDYVNLSTSRNTREIGSFRLIKLWRFVSAYISVFIKLLIKRYDLCYIALAFKGGLLKDAPFVMLCKFWKRKVMIHLHGKGAAEGANKRCYRWLVNNTLKNTKVIILSWHLYTDIAPFVCKEKVFVCPNGISGVDYEFKKRYNSTPQLLFLSNLAESKGVIVLLDALRILRDNGRSFYCRFVGGETKEIDARRFAKEVADRALNHVVTYEGIMLGKGKEEVFKQSDIFVFPTLLDCFPLVLLEAMQYGLPIVTTEEGAITDIVKDGVNGFICDKNSSISLADKLTLLLADNDLRNSIGETNYKKYHAEYTISEFENKIYSILSASLL